MLFSKKNKATGGFDFMVVGLGNPGLQYQNTRHNIGFVAADFLCESIGAEFKKSKFDGLTADIKIGDKRVLVLKPTTYMNLSGNSVQKAAKFYKLKSENIIVIFDDLTLDVGRLRIRAKGSDGGHRGMRDIIAKVGNDAIPRIKIGVGPKPHPDYDTKDFVLSRFSGSEMEKVETAAKSAAEAAKCMILNGVDKAMNGFNK